MTEFFLGAMAGASAWLLYFAGWWLYRWLHPWNEAVDARAQEYLIKPHPLWETEAGQEWLRRVTTWPSPTTAATPTLAAGRPPTTARAIKAPSSDALEAEPTIAPILPFSRSAPLTMPIIPAGQHSPFAVRQDVLPDGEKTPVSDA